MNETTWTHGVDIEDVDELKTQMKADAVIIGGGMAGTLAFYLLTLTGKRVVLIEKAEPEQSMTACTTAFLTHSIDTNLDQLITLFGNAKAKEIWQSHKDAIDQIEAIVQKEKIECEFMRCENILYASTESEYADVRDEVQTAHELGFKLRMHTKDKLPIENYGFATIPRQAKFHPLLFIKALRQIAIRNGGVLHEKTEATKIETIGDLVRVKTKQGSIEAEHVMIATYDPFNKPPELLFHRGTYISYVIELSVPTGLLPEAIYEDQQNPYHYMRVDKGKGKDSAHDRVVLGGGDHRHEIKLSEDSVYQSLENYFKRIAPHISYQIVRKWNGEILETLDGLAYIGRLSKMPNSFVATGFSGNGMTYSMIAARAFTDFVHDNIHPWEKLYSPQRSTPPRRLWHKGKDYVGELFRGVFKGIFKSGK